VQEIVDELGGVSVVIATGGLAPAVVKACRLIDDHDPWLTLKGLRLVWERNA
jgi:type III pantothenate kinase